MRTTFVYKNGRERSMSEREARVLQKLGRGTYLTRDMVAIQPPMPTPPPRDDESVPSADDTDTNGVAWNAAIHAASRAKNNDGTWRKKPGAKSVNDIESD